MTDELVAFLAGLDEDERIARTAIDPKHRGDWAWRKDSNTTVRTLDGVPIGPASRGVEIGPHIARWNPTRVLRKVEAARRIIDEHANEGGNCRRCASSDTMDVMYDPETNDETVTWPVRPMAYPCPTLRLLASEYDTE